MTALQTDRLNLRWLTLDDAGFMLSIWNDPAFVKFVGDRGIRTIDDAIDVLRTGPLAMYEQYGYGPYRLSLRATGETVGVCGLFVRKNMNDPDIGFAVLPDYRGRGYAGEAAVAVADYAQRTLLLPRLTALVSSANAASIGLIKKLGMRYECMITMPGDTDAVQLYAMDWDLGKQDNHQPAAGPVSDASAAVDWRQLREFGGVDIERSFVLSWQVERDLLSIDVDLFLTESHPFYERPRPAEKACIRAAILEFPCCVSISLANDSETYTPELATSMLRGGMIKGLRRVDNGPYVISGDFGTVTIDAERPILRLRRS